MNYSNSTGIVADGYTIGAGFKKISQYSLETITFAHPNSRLSSTYV